MSRRVQVRICTNLSTMINLSTIGLEGSPVAKVLDWSLEVSSFILQLCKYIHFWTDTIEKGMDPPYLPSYWLNHITAVLLQGRL